MLYVFKYPTVYSSPEGCSTTFLEEVPEWSDGDSRKCFHKNSIQNQHEPAILDDTPKRCFGQACLQGSMFNFVGARCPTVIWFCWRVGAFRIYIFQAATNFTMIDGFLLFHLTMTANPLSLNQLDLLEVSFPLNMVPHPK